MAAQGLLKCHAHTAGGKRQVCLGKRVRIKHAAPPPRRQGHTCEQLASQARQQVLLTSQGVEGAPERLAKRRVALLKGRHDVMAHIGTRGLVARVRRILAPAYPLLAQAIAQLLTRALDEGPHDDAARGSHAYQAGEARARKRAHEKGFRAVVSRVRHKNARRLHGQAVRPGALAGQAPGKVVAHLAGGLLHVCPRPNKRGNIDALRPTRNPELGTQVAHKRLVTVGLDAAQAVVHMEHAQVVALERARTKAVHEVDGSSRTAHEQCRGVRPPAHHQDERRGGHNWGRHSVEGLVHMRSFHSDIANSAIVPPKRQRPAGQCSTGR